MVFRNRRRRARQFPSRRRRTTPRNDQRLLTFDTNVYHGRELVSQFSAGNAAFTVSSLVVNMNLTNQLIDFSALYSMYRFTRLNFIYVPSASSSTLGQSYISYSDDIFTSAPASIVAAVSRGLSIQVPGTNTLVTLPSARKPISELPNVLSIPRSYNNLKWYRTDMSPGVNDMNSSGVVFYGTQGVQSGVVPGQLWLSYTVVLRSHI